MARVQSRRSKLVCASDRIYTARVHAAVMINIDGIVVGKMSDDCDVLNDSVKVLSMVA
jgi:hypothetical protein